MFYSYSLVSIMLVLYFKFLISFFLFDVVDDSRLNPFEERGDDAILEMKSNDPLEVSNGSILRPNMKWIQ